MTNRLQLDFSLTTNQERVEFINKYIQQPQFTTKPLTPSELETIANYLLWGKDPTTGLNAQQEGITSIDTKHSTWSKNSPVESLDGLLEQPQFSEASLHPLDQVPLHIPREVFSRKEALAQCPPYMVDTFTDLFGRIDHLDLVLSQWDMMHGKRKTPIRPSLLNKFSPEELAASISEAASLTQAQYLARRHLLVDLRREQYILRDQYSEPVQLVDQPTYNQPVDPPLCGIDIPILPLGLRPLPRDGTTLAPAQTSSTARASRLVFLPKTNLIPSSYSEEDLAAISDYYWSTKKQQIGPNQFHFDFREPEHVYQILQQWCELTDAVNPEDFLSTLPQLLHTLTYYSEMAELDDIQQEVLDMKLEKQKNTDIARAINKKWGKSYTPNYVSTIFRQKIIPKICEAAKYHELVVSNLFFEEEFVACRECGRVMLLAPCNFMRSSRSKTGYASRCKTCEKKKRKGVTQ